MYKYVRLLGDVKRTCLNFMIRLHAWEMRTHTPSVSWREFALDWLSFFCIPLFCFVLFLILSLFPSLLLVFRVSVYVFVDVVTHVFILFGSVMCFCFSYFFHLHGFWSICSSFVCFISVCGPQCIVPLCTFSLSFGTSFAFFFCFPSFSVFISLLPLLHSVGRGSSVGIATGYGLDGLGIEKTNPG
jgi:hypothetical protein